MQIKKHISKFFKVDYESYYCDCKNDDFKEDLEEFYTKFDQTLNTADIVQLSGKFGAGKTTFFKNLISLISKDLINIQLIFFLHVCDTISKKHVIL